MIIKTTDDMKIMFILLLAILVVNSIDFILREYRLRKDICSRKKALDESISKIDTLLKDQMVKTKIFEDRLDMFQVSISKTIGDVKDELHKIKTEKEKTKGTPLTSKEIADISFDIALQRLNNTMKNKPSTKHFSKIQLHKEIKRKTGRLWFIIRNQDGKQAYERELKKAYGRLFYKNNKRNKKINESK
jgi:hypothetical protein